MAAAAAQLSLPPGTSLTRGTCGISFSEAFNVSPPTEIAFCRRAAWIRCSVYCSSPRSEAIGIDNKGEREIHISGQNSSKIKDRRDREAFYQQRNAEFIEDMAAVSDMFEDESGVLASLKLIRQGGAGETVIFESDKDQFVPMDFQTDKDLRAILGRSSPTIDLSSWPSVDACGHLVVPYDSLCSVDTSLLMNLVDRTYKSSRFALAKAFFMKARCGFVKCESVLLETLTVMGYSSTKLKGAFPYVRYTRMDPVTGTEEVKYGIHISKFLYNQSKADAVFCKLLHSVRNWCYAQAEKGLNAVLSVQDTKLENMTETYDSKIFCESLEWQNVKVIFTCDHHCRVIKVHRAGELHHLVCWDPLRKQVLFN